MSSIPMYINTHIYVHQSINTAQNKYGMINMHFTAIIQGNAQPHRNTNGKQLT